MCYRSNRCFARQKLTSQFQLKDISSPDPSKSRQNKLESGPFSALATCANEAAVGDSCIILTPWFSKTKCFFCFSFNKRSPEDGLRKMCFFAYVISQKRKQTSGKKHVEHCLTHVNKTACEIWSISDKVHFWVNILTPFFHRTLQMPRN